MRRPITLAFGIFVALPGIGAAQPSEGEQRMACMGDAIRLCSQFIPNHANIERCMAAKHSQLSRTCMVVFDASAGPRNPTTR